MADPLRSGAIFRVPDASVLRQSPAPRSLFALAKQPASDAPSSHDSPTPAGLIRPQTVKGSPLVGSGATAGTLGSETTLPLEVVNRFDSFFRASPLPKSLAAQVGALQHQSLPPAPKPPAPSTPPSSLLAILARKAPPVASPSPLSLAASASAPSQEMHDAPAAASSSAASPLGTAPVVAQTILPSSPSKQSQQSARAEMPNPATPTRRKQRRAEKETEKGQEQETEKALQAVPAASTPAGPEPSGRVAAAPAKTPPPAKPAAADAAVFKTPEAPPRRRTASAQKPQAPSPKAPAAAPAAPASATAAAAAPALAGDKPKEVVLRSWCLKKEYDIVGCDTVIVEGARPSDPPNHFWHSSAIVGRLTPHRVQTKTGTVYVLEGDIDQAQTAANGFSEELAEAFAAGFPEDWQELVAKHASAEAAHQALSSKDLAVVDLSTDNPVPAVQAKVSDAPIRSHKAGASKAAAAPASSKRKREPEQKEKKGDALKGESKKDKKATKEKKDKKAKRARRASSEGSSSSESSKSTPRKVRPAAVRELEDLVAPTIHTTPPPKEEDSLCLGTSRSGRRLTPTLAYWKGQNIRYDGEGNAVGIASPAPPPDRASRAAARSGRTEQEKAEDKSEKGQKGKEEMPAKAGKEERKRAKEVPKKDKKRKARAAVTPERGSREGKETTPTKASGGGKEEEAAQAKEQAERRARAQSTPEGKTGKAEERKVQRQLDALLTPRKDQKEWTAEEDSILLDGHARFGNKWTEIAALLPGRTADVVRSRWRGKLSPSPQRSHKKQKRRVSEGQSQSEKEDDANEAVENEGDEDESGEAPMDVLEKAKVRRKEEAQQKAPAKQKRPKNRHWGRTRRDNRDHHRRRSSEGGDSSARWKPEQTELLFQAIGSAQLSTTDPLYWSRIAAVVGRTADECYAKFHRAHPTPAKKDKKAEKAITLNHLPGTNVQRRNIRKALNKAQEQHADDAFDQTPLRAKATGITLSPSLASPDNFPLKGPLLPVPSPGLSPGAPSPGILKRVNLDDMDAYITRIKKHKRVGHSVAKAKGASPPSDQAAAAGAASADSSALESPEKANDSLLSNPPEDEDEDYYFSE